MARLRATLHRAVQRQRGVVSVVDLDLIERAVQWHRHAIVLKEVSIRSQHARERAGGEPGGGKGADGRGGGNGGGKGGGGGERGLKEEERLSREVSMAVERRGQAIAKLRLSRSAAKTVPGSVFDVGVEDDGEGEGGGGGDVVGGGVVGGIGEASESFVWGDVAAEREAEVAEEWTAEALGVEGRDEID